MCVIDSKLLHCQKCKQSGKIIVNEISTCTSCPERDSEYNQFECPKLQENTLPPLTGVCAICDPKNGIPWGDWRRAGLAPKAPRTSPLAK